MNRNVVALALIAAGVVMSGCAAAAPIAASLGLAATSDSESRPDIEKDAIKSCDLFADHTKQISCKDEAAVEFDKCDEVSGLRRKKNCYKNVFNTIRQDLNASCNGNVACLEKIPPEKIKYD